MKSLKIAIILCLFMAISLPALAVEQERPVFVPRDRAPLSMSERGAQLSFAGKDEEKGLFELFVKKQDSLSFNQDPLADQLNAIEPAAGIQFRLEF